MTDRAARSRRYGALFALLGLAACAPAGGPETAEVETAEVARAEGVEEAPTPPVEREWPAGELRPGGRVEAELGPEETHRWRLPLAAGTFVRLTVEQDGVDVELAWLDPAGEPVLAAVDRIIGDRGPESVLAVAEETGRYTLEVRAYPYSRRGRYEAVVAALAPADEEARLAARTYRRFRQAEGLAPEEQTAAWSEALEVWRRLGETLLEGEVLFRMGGALFVAREFEPAVERLEEAAEAFERAGERRWQALALNRAAVSSWQMGRLESSERAIALYRHVLELAGEVADPLLAGQVHRALGQAYMRVGELQPALEHYEAALDLLPADDSTFRPGLLHEMGVLYSQWLNDPERGAEMLSAARDGWPPTLKTYRRFKTRTLTQLGRLAFERGDLSAARRSFEDGLELSDAADPCGRSVTLGWLALVEERQGRRRQADGHRDLALELVARDGCESDRATVLLRTARLPEARGEADVALAAFEAARREAELRQDRVALAESWIGIARVERARGRLDEAVAASAEALEIAEAIRPTVLREDLRTDFFATVQDLFDLHVDLLTRSGSHREAWAVAEAARARALRDLLAESGAGLRQAAAPELLERERLLRRRLRFAETRGRPEPREIDELIEELERVRGEIRRVSPRYAELIRPRLLAVEDVQRELLDDETLLLEYRLGETSSWLWAIGRESFSAHVLPPRSEIEPRVRQAVAWTQSLEWAGATPPVLCELSEILLSPVAERLNGTRRLVLVPHAELETLSFAALPEPADGVSCARAPPLVASHELAYLPSAATLAAQRRRLAGRRPAERWVAVVADPVYGPGDPRLGGRAVPAAEPSPLSRLPHSRREAESILRRLPPDRRLGALGFEAAKGILTGGGVSGYRILHLAAHGIFHPDQPLLSHFVLSRFDPRGRPIEGELYAHEIYDLDLPVELAVLSACDTARGRRIAGEGVVAGLPRALLYAGAARVVVSLWAVPDESTAELMERFYDGLLDRGEPPGRALQEAQRELWRDGGAPWRWAGFTLQGDWRPLPPF